jgi:endonuclease YncB( thermonuclease family)
MGTFLWERRHMFARVFFSAVVCFLGVVAPALAREGYVVRVEDDGAVVVSESRVLDDPAERYLFYGVEVPALHQPFGPESLAWLRGKLPRGTQVNLRSASRDSSGHLRALIQLGRDSINYQLLYQGLAWVNRAQCRAIFCRRWYIQEHQAVVEKRGLWSMTMSTPPWQWSR